MEVYPAYFVLLGIIVYLIAYFVYAKRYDKNVWKPDPKATTPAHMYMDGVEFFPSSKYVLYGFQFKGIAGAAPIVGPFVALHFGWLPALLWILLGNFFIGWIHDYGALFTSVRSEGKTLGPLTYELISPRARSCLMGFLLFYLITIAAAFGHVCSIHFNTHSGSLLFTIFVVIAGIISGLLLYKLKVHIGATTIIGIIIMIIGLYVSAIVAPFTVSYDWALFITCIICFISAILPIIWFAQPTNYMAFYPCIVGIILLLIGELASPITGISIAPQPLPENWYYPSLTVGPIWPMLCVSIACGAISGWHSLVSTSGSARQLDLETDALPIGAGSMLTEGLLALTSLGAYMAITQTEVEGLGIKWGAHTAFPYGASKLVAPLFMTTWDNPLLKTFFSAFIVLYAITVLQLVIRFWRLALTEVTAARPALRLVIGNKYVGSALGLAIGAAFAWTGAWKNLWTMFGGSNQLMAGLALLLVSIYLANVKKPTKYTLGPAIFMVVTCLLALIWETGIFFNAIATGKYIWGAKPPAAEVQLAFNSVFGIVTLILFILGIIVSYEGFKALSRAWKAEKKSE
ncbi:carbon starvation protein A [Candidatus Bathyarchaeota archaeon]|nr:MAG: carbon starvation protein A [Candidatus Bathyarchaeota archaeon]